MTPSDYNGYCKSEHWTERSRPDPSSSSQSKLTTYVAKFEETEQTWQSFWASIFQTQRRGAKCKT